jgi:DNA-binding protein YbaB
MERVDPAALSSLVRELRQSVDNAADTQRRVLGVTGTAFSPDQLIKVVVGPRGQLVELTIDPRVFRKPNAGALAAAIMSAARAAVEEAAAQTQAIVGESLPRADRVLPGAAGKPFEVRKLMTSHDADLKKMLDPDEDR